MNRSISTITAAVAILFAGLVSAAAQDLSDAKSIIAEHCIECHRVPGFFEEAKKALSR